MFGRSLLSLPAASPRSGEVLQTQDRGSWDRSLSGNQTGSIFLKKARELDTIRPNSNFSYPVADRLELPKL